MGYGSTLFDLGLSGLRAAQFGLATTSHNIANAGTAGYSRQRVELLAGVPRFVQGSHVGAGVYVGTGVQVAGVRRSYDQLLARELLADTAVAAGDRTQHGLASNIDSLFSDTATSLAPMLQGYFDALGDAAADPSSAAARQVVLDQAEGLAGRFRTLDSRLKQAHAAVEGSARSSVDTINSLASGIAQLNVGIVQANGTGGAPNDLLDQRDELVRQLAEQVGVTTQALGDGSINVFIGSGQTLVLGGDANRLSVGQSGLDPSATGLFLSGSGGSITEVTDQIGGGVLGAQVGFERGLLADADRQLGQIALGLAEETNAQHRLGLDQNGKIGGDLFTAVNSPALVAGRALGNASNTGDARLGVTLDSVGKLQDSDYRLSYDGSQYQLVRSRDSQVVGTFAALPQTLATEGFSIDLTSGAMAAGDSFTIRPSAGAAGAMRMVLSDTASLALASPVRTAAGTQNLGGARIGAASAANLAGVPLANPVTLTYDAASGGFLVGSPPGGTLAYDPSADSGSSLSLSVPGFGDLAFSITGTPADGDSFSIQGNVGGTGDNSNALALSGLQDTRILRGGTATLAQGYEHAVTNIAGRTNGLALAADAQEALLQQAQASRESESGVNLDEEAAALLQYQHAYEASARVITTANELFQTLLTALRG
jgi:flagellar hook-associated protein 1